jgi:hypothetical protein
MDWQRGPEARRGPKCDLDRLELAGRRLVGVSLGEVMVDGDVGGWRNWWQRKLSEAVTVDYYFICC